MASIETILPVYVIVNSCPRKIEDTAVAKLLCGYDLRSSRGKNSEICSLFEGAKQGNCHSITFNRLFNKGAEVGGLRG